MTELDLLARGASGMARERAILDVAARSVAAAQVSGRDFGDALGAMVRMLDAQRGYEANASIFDLGKKLAERTIELGRP